MCVAYYISKVIPISLDDLKKRDTYFQSCITAVPGTIPFSHFTQKNW